jgi:hypothetical protein
VDGSPGAAVGPGEVEHIKIIFNSDAYFDLLKKFPDASQYLVTVELGGKTYDIVEEAAKTESK